jgi:hypothetical protein
VTFLSSQGLVTVPVTVDAAVASGLSVADIVLEFAPAGTSNWTSMPNIGFSAAAPYTAQLGYNSFPTFPPLGGLYDVRVAVTDSSGNTGYSAPVTVAILDDTQATYVGLQNPGQAVHGQVTLTAAPEARGVGNTPDSVTFQIAQAGSGQWSTIGTPATAALDGAGNPIVDTFGAQDYTTALDTVMLANGRYDVRVLAEDSFQNNYVGGQISIVVDNTAPGVSLQSPGTPISGVVTLNASATDPVSGIASVTFEEAPAGSGAWSPIGTASSPPYTFDFDTRALPNGSYDLQAVATSRAGDTATSAVSGIAIQNAAATFTPGAFTVSNTVVPASGSSPGSPISLLGEIAGSSDHETWAFGYTAANAPVVDGQLLPFTAKPGDSQLVLLRYTDEGGWEIRDVLRNPDGSGFDVSPDALVSGQMASSGEAWLLVWQGGIGTLFHRQPGGPFIVDTLASAALAPMLSRATSATPPQLHIGVGADGSAYGLLINPSQRPTSTPVPAPGGSAQINTALQYGELASGSWSLQTADVPSTYVPFAGDLLTLTQASPTGPGAGWALFHSSQNPYPEPLLMGSFGAGGWQFTDTGLDALDLTRSFAVGNSLHVQPLALNASSDGVWIEAQLENFGATSARIVALYQPSSGHVSASWCDQAVLSESSGCGQPLDADHPAAVPDAVFDTSSGPVAMALAQGFVDVYANGTWTSVAAPGFEARGAGTQLFTDPTAGWLAGPAAMGQISAQPPQSGLVQWPEPNQATLVSVAAPPAGAGIATSGALAVGLDGAALHYDASAGWQVDPVPARAQGINLLGVAYDGSSNAVAVGGFGTILDWNGSKWSEDPQATSITENQLNAVSFAPNGQGWAVGALGTILHFDGTDWSLEAPDPQDSGTDITSVTVSGGQVFAVAGGNLIARTSSGGWQRVDPGVLPPDLPPGLLKLVSGLPDGGLVAAGNSVLLVRENSLSPLRHAAQPLNGSAVALAAYRDSSSGQVRAFVSVAPIDPNSLVAGSAATGFPPGDGELLQQTDTGWNDLSRNQYPNTGLGAAPLDGAPQPDPVLAVAPSPDGTSAWAVGGYAGTQTAAGLGTSLPLQSRPFAWQTSSIWRFDHSGSAQPPSLAQAQTILPEQDGVITFAFFSGAECVSQCSEVQNAQPDVNLRGASTEIANFAQQPGGPAFAMLGGNAVGPSETGAWEGGNGAIDLANLHRYIAPLGSEPLYAAYGPLDAVPTSTDPAEPWNHAFAQAPAPFGLGATPPNITDVSSGGHDGSVNHYYSFTVTQNGGTFETIVLDNSAGSLDASVPGQSAWLKQQLAQAQSSSTPVVVFCSEPLDSSLFGAANDADSVAAELAAAGVLGVFTTSPSDSDQVHQIPYGAPAGAPQIPEYEGASLTYQQTQNNGVLWYFASVNTTANSLSVQGIPVVGSLALEPVDGLNVSRSSTLSFRAVGERPAGTLPANVQQSNPQGFANYVSIPASSCSSCVSPSYSFTSSNTGVGNFVAPSGPGSPYPKLDSSGKPIPSSSSGLFCAFNAGQTTVSVTSGLLTDSLTVTVEPGQIGQPCGTVVYPPDDYVTVPGKTIVSGAGAPAPNPAAAAAPPAASPAAVSAPLPKIAVPPPPPPPAPTPAVAPPPPPPPALPSPPAVLVPLTGVALPAPVAIPPIPPPVTPVPPGGATASAQASARREERARKHASQSAFTTRPAGSSAVDWFYPVVGVMSLVGLMLILQGLRPGPRPRLALLEQRDEDHRSRIRERSRTPGRR